MDGRFDINTNQEILFEKKNKNNKNQRNCKCADVGVVFSFKGRT